MLLVLSQTMDQQLDKEWVLAVVAASQTQYEERLQRLEGLLEGFEQQGAMLASGYGELAAIIQAIVETFLLLNPEQRESFESHLKATRKQFLETLNHAHQAAQQSTDRFTAHATQSTDRPDSTSSS